MTAALTISKAERRHTRREKDKDRALEYFKVGMATVKPILASKPFIAIGGSIILYKLERANKIDGVSAGAAVTALMLWMGSDVIDAILPF